MESTALDAAGHRRSPATMPDYHQGRPPRNKGMRYPADPPPGSPTIIPGASIYLQGIDSSEIIDTVHARPASTISAIAGLSRR
jgi:hypothetical protein